MFVKLMLKYKWLCIVAVAVCSIGSLVLLDLYLSKGDRFEPMNLHPSKTPILVTDNHPPCWQATSIADKDGKFQTLQIEPCAEDEAYADRCASLPTDDEVGQRKCAEIRDALVDQWRQSRNICLSNTLPLLGSIFDAYYAGMRRQRYCDNAWKLNQQLSDTYHIYLNDFQEPDK